MVDRRTVLLQGPREERETGTVCPGTLVSHITLCSEESHTVNLHSLTALVISSKLTVPAFKLLAGCTWSLNHNIPAMVEKTEGLSTPLPFGLFTGRWVLQPTCPEIPPNHGFVALLLSSPKNRSWRNKAAFLYRCYHDWHNMPVQSKDLWTHFQVAQLPNNYSRWCGREPNVSIVRENEDSGGR